MAGNVHENGGKGRRAGYELIGRVLPFAAGAVMAALMLSSLALVFHVLLNAKPNDPVNNDGQILAILICGLAAIGAYTMLFAALKALALKLAKMATEVRRTFRESAIWMVEDQPK